MSYKKGHIPWSKIGLKGIHVSPATEFKKGYKNPPGIQAKITVALKEWYSNPANQGKKIIWADKISKTLMGHIVTKETKEKISLAVKGKTAGNLNPAKRPEVREKIRLSKLGPKNANWKGGITKNRDGYPFIRINGFYIALHRSTMEKVLGRPLQKGEIIHHINKNYQDNRIENLALCGDFAAHRWCHTEEAKIFFG